MAELCAVDEMRDSLVDLVQEIARVLNGYSIPMRKWFAYEVGMGGGNVEHRVDTWSLSMLIASAVRNNNVQLRAVSAIDKVAQSAVELNLNGLAKASPRRFLLGVTQFGVSTFVQQYFKKTGDFSFNSAIFDALFQELCKELASNTAKEVQKSPIANIALEVDSIGIAPGVVLRRISKGEYQEWLNIDHGDESSNETKLNTWERTSVTAVLESVHDVEKFPDHDDSKKSDAILKVSGRHFDILGRLIQVIRILGDGRVYSPFTETSITSFFQLGLRYQYGVENRMPGGRVTVSENEIPEILLMMSALETGRNSDILEMPVKRWATGVVRPDVADQLVDHWIGIESLFLPGDNQELRFRASLRVAAFIGDSADERETIFSDLLKSYNFRSKVVHGEGSGMKDGPELLRMTREYLRRSIIKIAHLEDKFQVRDNQIEKGLLRNSVSDG